jgi:DNA/RNA non-specific endonuclease/Pre-toxin TG
MNIYQIYKNAVLGFCIFITIFLACLPSFKALEQETINTVYGKPPILELNMPTGWEQKAQPQYDNEGYARGMFEYNSTHIFVDYYSKKKINEDLAKITVTPAIVQDYYILSEYGHNSSKTNSFEIDGRNVNTAQYIYLPSSKQICTNDKVVSIGNDWFELRYNSYYYYFSSTSSQNVVINPQIVNQSIQNYKKNYQIPIAGTYQTCWDKTITNEQLQNQSNFGNQDKINYLVNNEQFGDAIIQFKVCTSISNRDFNANVDSDALSQIRNLVKTLAIQKKPEQTKDQIIGLVDDEDDQCLKFFVTNALPRSDEEVEECHDKSEAQETKTVLTPAELRPMIKSQYDSKSIILPDGHINIHHEVIDALSDDAIMCLFDPPDESRLKALKANEDKHNKWKKERDGGFWGVNNVGYVFADGWQAVSNYDYAGTADNILGFVPIAGDVYDGYRATTGDSLAGKVSCTDRVITGAFTVVSVGIAISTGGVGSIFTKVGRVAIREIVENTGEKLVQNLLKTSLKETILKTLKKTITNATTSTIVSSGIQYTLAGVISPDKPKNSKPMTLEEQVGDNAVLTIDGDYNQTKLVPYYDQIKQIDTNVDSIEGIAYSLVKDPDNITLQDKLTDLLFVRVYAGSALYKKVKGGLELVVKNVRNLDPKSIYVHGVNRKYFIKTDRLGRQVRANTKKLELDPTPRDAINNKTLGKLPDDHAGHLFADMFGGTKKFANLVSMNGSLNLNGYRDLERIWALALKDGKKVAVKIDVKYDGDSVRPSSFVVEYKIDGGELVKETFKN